MAQFWSRTVPIEMLHEMRTLNEGKTLCMTFMDGPLSESKRIYAEFGCMYRIEILNRSYALFQTNPGDESVMALRAEISALKIEEESDKKKLNALVQTQAHAREENGEKSLEETVAEFVDAAGVLTAAIDAADSRNAQYLLAPIVTF